MKKLESLKNQDFFFVQDEENGRKKVTAFRVKIWYICIYFVVAVKEMGLFHLYNRKEIHESFISSLPPMCNAPYITLYLHSSLLHFPNFSVCFITYRTWDCSQTAHYDFCYLPDKRMKVAA
jgi:hypothetical protein